MLAPVLAHQRRFQLVLIKPSHYDDDGYVIQWMRSGIPSNSLASLYALAADAARRQVLGSDVAIDITHPQPKQPAVRFRPREGRAQHRLDAGRQRSLQRGRAEFRRNNVVRQQARLVACLGEAIAIAVRTVGRRKQGAQSDDRDE